MSSQQGQAKAEPKQERKNPLTEFLEKEVLENMNDYFSFVEYQQRYDKDQRKPCIVSPDVFDIVTKGDLKSPLFWTKDVAVVDNSRKQAAFDMLGGTHKIEQVIIR